MRERTLLGGFILLCLLLMAGCTAANISQFDTDDFSKAQKIVVHDAAGREKAVLTEEPDIDEFVEAMDVEGWRLAKLPDGLAQAGSFTLWQAETVKAYMEAGDADFWEICTFRFYENGDYLTIDTGLADIEITFAIPQNASDYLQTLIA